MHDVGPQELVSPLLTQLPPQLWVAFGHAHMPFWHVVPLVHGLLHAPQLALSLVKSAHPPAQGL
jgi:hypothetical protein